MKDFKNVYCDCSKINKLIKSIINKAKEDILSILKQSKDGKSNGFVQPVLEVHNAFSHLATFFIKIILKIHLKILIKLKAIFIERYLIIIKYLLDSQLTK